MNNSTRNRYFLSCIDDLLKILALRRSFSYVCLMIFIVSLVICFLGLPRFWPIVGGVLLFVLYCAYSCLNLLGVILRWLAAHFTVTFPAACFSRHHLTLQRTVYRC